MKDLAKTLISSLIGSIIGYGLASRGQVAVAADVPRVEAKELVVVGDSGKPVARIVARSGGAALELYDGEGNRAIELGFDGAQSMRFLTFLNHDGRILASLNSSAPRGETTLYLGDEDLQARVVLGAIRSDVKEPVKDWGLQIQRRGSLIPAFSILTRPGNAPNTWTTGLRIIREDGKAWTAPN